MVLIVWYHTDHPVILDYPFYNSTLFFVSGVLFKPDGGSNNVKNRIQKLLIPFAFFYLIYYFFLLLLNGLKFGHVSPEIATCIFDVFRCYTDNDAFTCNYPLWFIWALLWVQLLSIVIVRFNRQQSIQLALAFCISVIGFLYVRHIPTPFIIGRSLTFLFFYMMGHVLGKKLVKSENVIAVAIGATVIWLVMYSLQSTTPFLYTLKLYAELGAFAVMLFCICKLTASLTVIDLIAFFGINSLVVFGMHDMYLTILRILTQNIIGTMNVWLGILNWIIALVLMIPTIWFLNNYCPFFIGKKKWLHA